MCVCDTHCLPVLGAYVSGNRTGTATVPPSIIAKDMKDYCNEPASHFPYHHGTFVIPTGPDSPIWRGHQRLDLGVVAEYGSLVPASGIEDVNYPESVGSDDAVTRGADVGNRDRTIKDLPFQDEGIGNKLHLPCFARVWTTRSNQDDSWVRNRNVRLDGIASNMRISLARYILGYVRREVGVRSRRCQKKGFP